MMLCTTNQWMGTIKEMHSSTCEEVFGKVKREQKVWMSENT